MGAGGKQKLIRRSEIVLILGAGASMPYGLPSGRDLKKDVIIASRSRDCLSLCEKSGVDISGATNFEKDLDQSLRQSVDAFLETRPEYMKLGKALIAYCLIQKEDPKALFSERNDDRWIEELYRYMDTDKLDDFGDNRVSIITFNYDRSFEYRMLCALQADFGRPVEECAAVLDRIPIIHVHGQIGRLVELGKGGRSYDVALNAKSLRIGTEGIRIIHENNDDDEIFIRAQQIIQKAKRVIFLGFGYHPMNLKRLGFVAAEKRGGPTVFGTVHQLTESEVAHKVAPLLGLNSALTYDRQLQNHRARDFIRNNVNILK